MWCSSFVTLSYYSSKVSAFFEIIFFLIEGENVSKDLRRENIWILFSLHYINSTMPLNYYYYFKLLYVLTVSCSMLKFSKKREIKFQFCKFNIFPLEQKIQCRGCMVSAPIKFFFFFFFTSKEVKDKTLKYDCLRPEANSVLSLRAKFLACESFKFIFSRIRMNVSSLFVCRVLKKWYRWLLLPKSKLRLVWGLESSGISYTG